VPSPAARLGAGGGGSPPPAQPGQLGRATARATAPGRPAPRPCQEAPRRHRRPLAPRIPPGETGGPTFPPEPTPCEEPRSARWQGGPAGAFSAGHLRSPCQKEGAEGLGFSSAPSGEVQGPLPYAGQASLQRPDRRRLAASPRPLGAPPRGCRGFLPLTIPMLPGSSAEAERQSGGDAAPAATLTRSR
jgi:hypothetical protein